MHFSQHSWMFFHPPQWSWRFWPTSKMVIQLLESGDIGFVGFNPWSDCMPWLIKSNASVNITAFVRPLVLLLLDCSTSLQWSAPSICRTTHSPVHLHPSSWWKGFPYFLMGPVPSQPALHALSSAFFASLLERQNFSAERHLRWWSPETVMGGFKQSNWAHSVLTTWMYSGYIYIYIYVHVFESFSGDVDISIIWSKQLVPLLCCSCYGIQGNIAGNQSPCASDVKSTFTQNPRTIIVSKIRYHENKIAPNFRSQYYPLVN